MFSRFVATLKNNAPEAKVCGSLYERLSVFEINSVYNGVYISEFTSKIAII